ncbi:COQ9 family protein [uncultured Litoreibacter sp.]|uniref:COQ9 family protein n=1 Tax=uncultured Litoreibacter sp. TaxID=1392394 RepID=UPI00261BCB79|nr:COQ9 family protein [uncultured Litoreibacter sp.]
MSDTEKNRLLDAALDHVMFDGWSDETFQSAVQDTGIELAVAKSIFPRTALDMAIAFHERGDAQMAARMKRENLLGMRYSERVAAGVRYRLEAVGDHKEAVRRGSALFALPQNAALGAKLVWGTADAIWTELGDSSDDFNWYSKRTILSGVYGSTVLFWLGDDSEGHEKTWEFLDRRIENVMQFEKFKAQMNDNPLASKLMAGPNWLMSKVKAPSKMRDPDLPGFMSSRPHK